MNKPVSSIENGKLVLTWYNDDGERVMRCEEPTFYYTGQPQSENQALELPIKRTRDDSKTQTK